MFIKFQFVIVKDALIILRTGRVVCAAQNSPACSGITVNLKHTKVCFLLPLNRHKKTALCVRAPKFIYRGALQGMLD